MPKFLFAYNDRFSGKVAVDGDGIDEPRKLSSGRLRGKYDKKFVKYVDESVGVAQSGDFIGSIESLLIIAHFLERKWPIPESLANYVATTLQEAVIAFGHTEGSTDKRNAAIVKALGLVRPRGAARKMKQMTKQFYVHGYIWWRIKLFEETLYVAAKHANEAFKGTDRLGHDACEKIYNEVKNKWTKNSKNSRTMKPWMKILIVFH